MMKSNHTIGIAASAESLLAMTAASTAVVNSHD